MNVLGFLASLVTAVPMNQAVAILDSDGDVSGTGVLLSETAVLTAAHVVEKVGQQLEIRCKRDTILGEVTKYDKTLDLALIELTSGCLQVGVTKLARGNPDEGDTVTMQGFAGGSYPSKTTRGAVMNYELVTGADKVVRFVMAVEMLIAPGNSGGPVVNDKRELVGIAMGRECVGTWTPPACHSVITPLNVIQRFLHARHS